MPSLTVTEKNHWKERIARRIDKRIEGLLAAEPNLMDRIHREARQRSLQSLGLADGQAELDNIEHQKDMLEKRSQQVLKLMLAHVRGVPVDDLEDTCYGYHREEEVKSAVAKRQKVHEDELLAECDTGKRLVTAGVQRNDCQRIAFQLRGRGAQQRVHLGPQGLQLRRTAREPDGIQEVFLFLP